MLISEALALFKAESAHYLHINNKVLLPSKLVLFLCDILQIVRKAHTDTPNEFIITTVRAMLTQRTVEQIPGLLVDFTPDTAYDHYINNQFTLNPNSTEKNYILISTTSELVTALQMMHSHSVIYTDEEIKYIVAQWQTKYYRTILSGDCLQLLLEPVYKILGMISQERVETAPMYVIWRGNDQILKELEYDYAIEMNGEGIKGIKGAIWV
ncbi:Hypothetical_protein [Hexamita inflata]|uniref:Hypothetical_protein n=1 Tax=Hexamita inflata TaxID=28002 RepID=A0AA86V6J1_9EUKA|nr:Hypothetical protein HINF_LOCUS66031 [Hexamita inflata]